MIQMFLCRVSTLTSLAFVYFGIENESNRERRHQWCPVSISFGIFWLSVPKSFIPEITSNPTMSSGSIVVLFYIPQTVFRNEKNGLVSASFSLWQSSAEISIWKRIVFDNNTHRLGRMIYNGSHSHSTWS